MQKFKRDHIRAEIENLQGSVLTFYLNTNPRSEEWKIHLKNGLKRTEEYAKASNSEQAKVLTKVIDSIQAKVREQQRDLTNSLVCFASANEVLIYPFQFPVENDFVWETAPATEQLEQLFEKYVRTGVVILQADQVTLLTASLGELVDNVHYQFDIDTEDWTQFKGLAFGAIISSSAKHTHKFEQRLKENQARWYRDLAPKIEAYASNQGWKSVHLLGPAELTNNMKRQLNLEIDSEINRNYSGDSAHDILAKTIYAPVEA